MGTKSYRKWWGVALVLLAVSGFGCNPFLVPQFLFGSRETKIPPKYAFFETAKKAKDKKEITIVVLPDRGRGLSPDFFGQERELASITIAKLEEGFTANKEKVKIIPLKDVSNYMSGHPDWKTPVEIGKHFEADYVFHVELGALSLYEPRSYGQFLRGNCRVAFSIVDVGTGEAVFRENLSPQYPKDGRNLPNDMDNNVDRFRNEYFARIASRMVRFVTASLTPDYIDVD